MSFTENQLEKIVLRQYIAPFPGSPGSPGRPAQPARTIKQKRKVCGVVYSQPYGPTGSGAEIGGGGYAPIGPAVATGYECKTVTTTVYIPAIPAIPAVPARPATPEQTIIDFQIGWNARAHSAEPVRGAGGFKFKVPNSTSGAVVGLSRAPRQSGYNDILYGFYVFDGGVVQIIEAGAEREYIGAHPDSELAVLQAAGQIVYTVDGVTVKAMDAPMLDEAYLSAALYTGGDTVNDAGIAPAAVAVGGLRPMVGFAGDALLNYVHGSLRPMQGEASATKQGSIIGSMRPMYGAAADASGFAFAHGSMLPMRGEASASPLTPRYAFADNIMLPMNGTAGGVHHIVGDAEGSMRPMVGLSSDYAYSQTIGAMWPMRGYADGIEQPWQATVFSAIAPLDNITASVSLYAIINSDMTLAGVMSVQSVAGAAISSSLSFDSSHTTALTLKAVIRSWMEANADAFGLDDGQQYDTWVLHMDAAGSTRYEGYGFNSFARVGGRHYGMRSDGIYLLQGPDDAGRGIEQRVNFGNLNFGTSNRKALPYVYVGAASNGDTFLRVTADAQTYTYRVRNSTEHMKEHRFELGRGLRATFYELELASLGTTFDLESVEFFPVALQRRL